MLGGVPYPGLLGPYTGLVVAVLYAVCSASMAFANKAVLTSFDFDFPFFLVTCQMVFAIVLLEALRAAGGTSLVKFTWQRGRDFLLPSVFYAVNAVLSLSALSGMNIPMYGLIKRCSPLVILLVSALLLNRGWPPLNTALPVTMITLGCIIAGYGDLAFDVRAYAYGAGSVLSQSVYLVLVQKHAGDQSAAETLHLNSYNTLPLLLVCCVVSGELHDALLSFDLLNPAFVVVFTVVISIGCLLNYLLFLCTQLNSALTTSVAGTVKTVVQTVLGMFTFSGISINVFTLVGISMNLSGGVLYTYVKYRLSQHRRQVVVETIQVDAPPPPANGVIVSGEDKSTGKDNALV